jgi:hypothetical protein
MVGPISGRTLISYCRWGIYAISSKFGKFPVNIRVVVAREAYKEACIGKYRALQRYYAIFSILLTGSFASSPELHRNNLLG